MMKTTENNMGQLFDYVTVMRAVCQFQKLRPIWATCLWGIITAKAYAFHKIMQIMLHTEARVLVLPTYKIH